MEGNSHGAGLLCAWKCSFILQLDRELSTARPPWVSCPWDLSPCLPQGTVEPTQQFSYMSSASYSVREFKCSSYCRPGNTAFLQRNTHLGRLFLKKHKSLQSTCLWSSLQQHDFGVAKIPSLIPAMSGELVPAVISEVPKCFLEQSPGGLTHSCESLLLAYQESQGLNWMKQESVFYDVLSYSVPLQTCTQDNLFRNKTIFFLGLICTKYSE